MIYFYEIYRLSQHYRVPFWLAVKKQCEHISFLQVISNVSGDQFTYVNINLVLNAIQYMMCWGRGCTDHLFQDLHEDRYGWKKMDQFTDSCKHWRVRGGLKVETHSEPCQSLKISLFAKMVNGFQLLSVFAKCSVLDVWQDFE